MMTKEEVHEAIDRLNDDQLRPVATLLEEILPLGEDPVLHRLKGIPGIRLPAHWPPRFEKVEPLEIEGELASDRLIRERR
jgi:hypothetical protein